MATFVTRALTRVRGRLRRWLGRVGYAAFGVGTALGFLATAVPVPARDLRVFFGTPLGALGVVALVGATLTRLFARRTRPGELRAPGALEAREGGAELVLVADGREHRVPIATTAGGLVDGHVVPERALVGADGTTRQAPAEVVLELHGGDVWRVEVADVSEGLELLGALGLGGRARTLRVPRRQSGTVVLTTFILFALAPFAMVPVAFAAIVIPPASVVVFAVALLLRVGAAILGRLQPGPLSIGADGVAWNEGKRRRFVPHRDIEDATLQSVGTLGHRDLVLATRDGVVRVPLGPLEPDLLEAVRAHVLAARGEAVAATQAFARGGRDYEAWKRDVEELIKGDYRKVGVPKVRVLETLEDPHAPADQRLGAAMALAADSPELAANVARDIARACADRELADALEALAEARLDPRRAEAVAGG